MICHLGKYFVHKTYFCGTPPFFVGMKYFFVYYHYVFVVRKYLSMHYQLVFIVTNHIFGRQQLDFLGIELLVTPNFCFGRCLKCISCYYLYYHITTKILPFVQKKELYSYATHKKLSAFFARSIFIIAQWQHVYFPCRHSRNNFYPICLSLLTWLSTLNDPLTDTPKRLLRDVLERYVLVKFRQNLCKLPVR